MSKCDNCGQEGLALAQEHSVNPEFCPKFMERKVAKSKQCPKCKSANLNISEFGTFCNDCDWELARVSVGIGGGEHQL